ncbi:hypothetical protein BKA69DRAFT_526174 [Paraphysoderma sedebokerense]|nr:hypothetical protein BKA69DRAFT_526174 [Paraphysoderma sedebokerense]
MDTLTLVQNSTLSTNAIPANFDPVVRKYNSLGDSIYFQRLLNDSSRYVVTALSSTFGVLPAVTLPYIVNFPTIPSHDCRVDTQGNIFTAFTSTMSSSIGLGGTDIILSRNDFTTGALSFSVVISTARQDNVSRIYLPNNNSIMVTGTTDGNLSARSSPMTGRRIFLARFQEFSISSVQTGTPNKIQDGGLFNVIFSSLPGTVTSTGILNVTLQSRFCNNVTWVNNATISAVAPTGIGRLLELYVSFPYLPHNPSVVDFRLSYPNPVIVDVRPAQGPAIGFNITLTVRNLGILGIDSVSVTIGDSLCLNTNQISADRINCTVPAGSGKGYRVIVSTDSSQKSSENILISYDPPRLTAVSPNVGPGSWKNCRNDKRPKLRSMSANAAVCFQHIGYHRRKTLHSSFIAK